MRPFAKIFLKPGKEKPVKRFHLWVFSGAVQRIEGAPKDGDWVEIYSNNNDFLALAYYNEGSICARIISFEKMSPGPEMWHRKVNFALALRKHLGFFDDPETNMFRLINGEGDNFPGLVVDFYNGVIVVQAQTKGMYNAREEIASALLQLLGGKVLAIYDKSHAVDGGKDSQPAGNTFLYGSSDQVEVKEYGNIFKIDIVEGQKTGFFIDQRENRKLLEHYSQGKEVLNMFSYTGGFSVYAARGGANRVVSVDVSPKAMQLAWENMSLNGFKDDRYSTEAKDVFKFFAQNQQHFDCIVLDPPAFAKHLAARKNAINGYRNVNKQAISNIKSGGLLFTFSCSQLVSVADFRTAVFSAAAMTGRRARLLYQLSQPPDHPVNIYHPEGEYLKGLVVAID